MGGTQKLHVISFGDPWEGKEKELLSEDKGLGFPQSVDYRE